MTERQIAFQVLVRVEREKAYSNLALDAALKRTPPACAKSFVTALVYGVLERQITLDTLLAAFLRQPIKRLRPEVLIALRLGAYQIYFMDKVPQSAAVNESVRLVRKNGCAFAAGLVNSVLRRLCETPLAYPETGDLIYDWSVRYSCPKPLVAHFLREYGEADTQSFLAASFGGAPVVLRVNTLKTDAAALMDRLAQEGVQTDLGALPDTLTVRKGNISEELCAYQEGLFHVQDTASGMCVQALDLSPGMTLLDLCAAPGGKSFTAAELMQNRGEILAFDLHPHRVQLMESGARRLGITMINAKPQDATIARPELFGRADRVLCDVPCSGLGVLRRKPEIRFRALTLIDNLCEIQYNILVHASKYLRRGGLLVYSTCTLSHAENEDVCDRFLRAHPDFQQEGAYRTLMPHKDGTDGFFIARLRSVT